MAKKKAALGRGLGALIDDSKYEEKPSTNISAPLGEVAIERIQTNPFQPRTNIAQEGLEELASSIKELGIIQPITLRKLDDENFQLISGERRFRAAKLAGMKKIPAYIRDADDQALLEMALVENIQREDLNAIEVAISYQRLIEECDITQEIMSDRVGKKRSTITNYLRLLKLPAEIQVGIRDQKIAMGHARALINIDNPQDQVKVYKKIINQDLSVRKTEEIVKALNEPKKKKKEAVIPETYKNFRNELAKQLDTKVQLKRNVRGNGRLIIPFKNDEQFEYIKSMLEKLK